MVTGAHVASEFGDPSIDIPFQTCSGDGCRVADGNDTNVFSKKIFATGVKITLVPGRSKNAMLLKVTK